VGRLPMRTVSTLTNALALAPVLSPEATWQAASQDHMARNRMRHFVTALSASPLQPSTGVWYDTPSHRGGPHARGEGAMDFYTMPDQVVDLLRSRQRVTYRTLKRQFDLDDAALEDLKDELLFAHPQIADEDGRGLVWTVDIPAVPRSTDVAAPEQARAPLTYTSPHREDSNVPHGPRRGTQAGHGTVCRPQRLSGVARGPRPRGGPPAPRPGAGADDGRGAPL